MLHRHQCVRSFGDWLQSILEFSETIQAMHIEIPPFAALCALTLITGLYSKEQQKLIARGKKKCDIS